MQIHELNNFTGTLGAGSYVPIDDGNDTGKLSHTAFLAPVNARIDNIIAGEAPSAEEIVDARLGADGVPYPSLGDAIRDQFTDVKSDFGEFSLNSFDKHKGTMNGAGTSWMNINDSWLHIVIPVNPGDTYDIVHPNGDGQLAWLRSYSGTSSPPDLSQATGYTGRVSTSATGRVGTVPSDVHYIWMIVLLDGTVYLPTKFKVNDWDYVIDVRKAIDNIDADVATKYSDIMLLMKNQLAVLKEPIINGYNDANNYNVNLSVAPFILDQNIQNRLISSVTLNVKTAGKISMGYYNATPSSGPIDRSKLIVTNEITINSTGTQTVLLQNPFVIPNGAYFFVGVPTDTLIFAYGPNGDSKGFYYTSNDTLTHNDNSIGLLVYGYPNTSSVYGGKSISILGDSISTYSGYIPSGNVAYYPSGTVQNVTDTWWHKLLTALGMTLNVNNSWSGSRVTTTDGDASAGCMTRCQNLGTNPDVIIVWMGINDFNNEVALGTYDGTTALPTVTATFREAYAIMLNKILTSYQSAEVWVCTLPQCERNAESGFPEINGNGVALAEFNKAILELANAFGVKVLDHNKCGLTYQNMPTFNPDNLHPNKYGHSLVANNDIRQMDNLVRARYPIA